MTKRKNLLSNYKLNRWLGFMKDQENEDYIEDISQQIEDILRLTFEYTPRDNIEDWLESVSREFDDGLIGGSGTGTGVVAADQGGVAADQENLRKRPLPEEDTEEALYPAQVYTEVAEPYLFTVNDDAYYEEQIVDRHAKFLDNYSPEIFTDKLKGGIIKPEEILRLLNNETVIKTPTELIDLFLLEIEKKKLIESGEVKEEIEIKKLERKMENVSTTLEGAMSVFGGESNVFIDSRGVKFDLSLLRITHLDDDLIDILQILKTENEKKPDSSSGAEAGAEAATATEPTATGSHTVFSTPVGREGKRPIIQSAPPSKMGVLGHGGDEWVRVLGRHGGDE